MMLFQIAEGLLGTVLCMSLGWILLEKVFLVPYGSMILWILSPALFLRCIQSVFLGYFQSEGSEMPSAVSSVLRQVFFLGLGLVFLGIFRNYGEKVSLLLKGQTLHPCTEPWVSQWECCFRRCWYCYLSL